MAKGATLSPQWQRLAASLGTAATTEVIGRKDRLQHRTRVHLVDGVCLAHTRRTTVVDGRVTAEPKVLVQITRPADVFAALIRVLPPVAELRADPDGDQAPVPVPLLDLTDDPSVPVAIPARPDADPMGEQASGERRWVGYEELMRAAAGDPLGPDADAAEQIAARLADLPDGDDGSAAAAALASVPGVAPGDLAREVRRLVRGDLPDPVDLDPTTKGL